LQTIRQRLLTALADAYERSGAGKTGVASRSVGIVYRDLLAAAQCREDSALTVAEHEIKSLAADGLLVPKFARRDESVITKIELDLTNEARLYEALGRPSPTQRRTQLAALFRGASSLGIPEQYRPGWMKMCESMAFAAESGAPVAPFSRNDGLVTSELLRASARLLGWNTESLLRFASCQVFGNSKRLEEMRGPIETVIACATEDGINCLSQLGILDNPRRCHFSGPAILHFAEGAVDLTLLRAPLMISMVDLARCVRVETSAARFCTVENPTSFHELAKLGGDTLLACTDGYAGSALLAFITRLPTIPKYHFGDSDPAGFDILADLRARSGLEIESLHMAFRAGASAEPLTPKDLTIADRVLNSAHVTDSEKKQVQQMVEAEDKGVFEQEMLGVPPLREWPFYGTKKS
jgi:hypothetical protein